MVSLGLNIWGKNQSNLEMGQVGSHVFKKEHRKIIQKHESNQLHILLLPEAHNQSHTVLLLHVGMHHSLVWQLLFSRPQEMSVMDEVLSIMQTNLCLYRYHWHHIPWESSQCNQGPLTARPFSVLSSPARKYTPPDSRNPIPCCYQTLQWTSNNLRMYSQSPNLPHCSSCTFLSALSLEQ